MFLQGDVGKATCIYVVKVNFKNLTHCAAGGLMPDRGASW